MLTRSKPTATNLNSYIVVKNYPQMVNNNRNVKAKSELLIRQPQLSSNDLTYRSLDKFSLNSNRQSKLKFIPIKNRIIPENSSSGSSTPLGLSKNSSRSSSSSSASFEEEELDNLNEFLYSIRKRIDTIEANYSTDSLFNCLRHYLKHDGYSHYSLNFLETFRLKLSKMSLITLQMDKDYESVKKNMLRNSMSPDTLKSVMAPVKKLFKNLNLLRHIYKIIQRDLVFNVLVKTAPEVEEEKKGGKNLMPKENSRLEFQKNHLDLNYETRRFTLKSRINISNNKNLKRLNKYHQILYELNEKVLILLNDKENSDLKVLSNQTKLEHKYEYYKSGEYVLRLVPDIIYKMKLILKLCQKCFEMSDKFNLNSNSTNDDDLSKLVTMKSTLTTTSNNNRNLTQSTLLSNNDKTIMPTSSDYDYVSRDEIKYTIVKRQVNKLPNIQENKNQTPIQQINRSDSYIRETDSSVLSDDSNRDGYENYKHKTAKKKKTKKLNNSLTRSFRGDYQPAPLPRPPTINHPPPSLARIPTLREADKPILVENYQKSHPHHQILPPIKKIQNDSDYTEMKPTTKTTKTEIDVKDRDELYDEYLRKKDELAECKDLIDELKDDLKNLIDRTERCTEIKDKISSVISIIRETEVHLNKTDDDDKEVKIYLQKELNLLKYRLNLLTQDLDVEEIIKNELNDAIKETNRRLNKSQEYFIELMGQLEKLDNEIKILYKEFF
jgi:hypothetical protein